MAVSADAFRRVSRRPWLRRNVTSCVIIFAVSLVNLRLGRATKEL